MKREIAVLRARAEGWENEARTYSQNADHWRARAEAAEAECARLREALRKAIRAANLALFVIRKYGVMPNDSWRTGFEKDLADAKAALAAPEDAP